jgi:hypothetical protein
MYSSISPANMVQGHASKLHFNILEKMNTFKSLNLKRPLGFYPKTGPFKLLIFSSQFQFNIVFDNQYMFTLNSRSCQSH